MYALLNVDGTFVQFCSKHDRGDNTFTLVNLDGTSLSVQPDGSHQSRPAGTYGAWETCTIDGAIVAYAPGGVGGKVFPYLIARIPNA